MSRSNWPTSSRQLRGYGRQWEKLRTRVLERDIYLCRCQRCKAEGRTMLATEVDHIKPKAKGGTDDSANLQAISRECHARKSVEDQGATPRPRVRVGIDGYPVA